jgi:hypothetical protein
MILLAIFVAGALAMAQDNDKDETAKQDMQSAGHHTKKAAKDIAHGTKKGAQAVGHGVKHGAIATKNAVTGGDDAREDRHERANDAEHVRSEGTAQERAEHDRDGDRDSRRALPQSEGNSDWRADRNARNVHIIAGPEVDAGDRSATLRWRTDGVAANDVWLQGGGIRGHRTLYDRSGSRDHNLTFTNLRPNTTYHYIIRTRDGDVRQEGSFTTR